MTRKIISALALAIALSVPVSACGSDAGTPVSADVSKSPVAKKKAAPKPPTKVNFEGSWAMVNPEPALNMTAMISNDTIEIIWDLDDLTALYWKGSFPTTDQLSSIEKIESVGDVPAMDASLLGSQNKTKTFTYKDGRLAFELTVMGTTRVIELER